MFDFINPVVIATAITAVLLFLFAWIIIWAWRKGHLPIIRAAKLPLAEWSFKGIKGEDGKKDLLREAVEETGTFGKLVVGPLSLIEFLLYRYQDKRVLSWFWPVRDLVEPCISHPELFGKDKNMTCQVKSLLRKSDELYWAMTSLETKGGVILSTDAVLRVEVPNQRAAETVAISKGGDSYLIVSKRISTFLTDVARRLRAVECSAESFTNLMIDHLNGVTGHTADGTAITRIDEIFVEYGVLIVEFSLTDFTVVDPDYHNAQVESELIELWEANSIKYYPMPANAIDTERDAVLKARMDYMTLKAERYAKVEIKRENVRTTGGGRTVNVI